MSPSLPPLPSQTPILSFRHLPSCLSSQPPEHNSYFWPVMAGLIIKTALLVSTLTSLVTAQTSQSCSASSQCPESAPCCSREYHQSSDARQSLTLRRVRPMWYRCLLSRRLRSSFLILPQFLHASTCLRIQDMELERHQLDSTKHKISG